ncbi:hypothetical protein EDC04DRAFT_2900605 [Pisolithus marmoratus]|nr:hypothetical protein EDC04DRAFT_2900605 [Pisolithus marmoratus]
MPNGISHGNNTFALGASTFPTGAAHHVTDHSPALDGETALDTPDQLGHSLDINEWCEMLPRDDPPHPMSISGAVRSDMPSSKSIKVHPPTPLSTIRKRVHSEMIGNDNTISTPPFANASDIDTVISSNKHLWLSAAMDHASSHHPHKVPTISDPMAAGLQGTINYLTSLI